MTGGARGNAHRTMACRRRRETTVDQRQTLINLANANIPTKDIARILNVDRSTVQRWRKRHEETNSLENKRRPGGPRHTTEEEDALIINAATDNPLTTAVRIKASTEVNVGVHTVRKRLHEAGLHHRTPATKPFITETNREERLGFALEYYPVEATFWQQVVFCDEKTFASDDHGRLHCWRRDNTR